MKLMYAIEEYASLELLEVQRARPGNNILVVAYLFGPLDVNGILGELNSYDGFPQRVKFELALAYMRAGSSSLNSGGATAG